MNKAYKCDKNGFFLYENKLYLDPVNGQPVLHLNETTVEILPDKQGFVRKFDFNSQTWQYVENHKGEIWYSKETGEQVEIKEYGEVSFALTDKKPKPYSTWNEAKKEWIIDESLVGKAIAEKKGQLTILSESKTEELIKSIPKFTSKTEQRMEAVLYKIDNSYPVPHLSSIARKLNIPLAEVVENTLREQDKEADKRGEYVADDAIFKNRIDAATTLDELDKIEQDILAWK